MSSQVEGGCQKPDACEWNWWPRHCQCRTTEGKRADASEPPEMVERNRLSAANERSTQAKCDQERVEVATSYLRMRVRQAEQELERVRAVVDEFDSWLSLRGEFAEVLRAFRDAFGSCEQIDDAEFGCGGSGTADPGSCPDGCPDCTGNSPSTEPGDVERLERCARGLEEAAGRAGFQAQIDAYLDGAAFLHDLASRLSPEGGREKVVFPVHRVAALFRDVDRKETRTNLIGRVERDVEDLADKGEHLADATERMGLELVLRPVASTQPNPTTHLSEGTRDRLEAAGREFDTRVKNQESVHEPLPEDRIREIYESHATTPQPQDEEER